MMLPDDDDVARTRTGPNTPEGLAAVSRNAVKHGLSGSGLILPEKEARKARRREDDLVSEYRPRDRTEALLVKKMAIHSVKAEQAYQIQIEIRTRAVERARDHWRTDRRANINKLTARIASEPDRIVRLLFQSLDGVEWLLERWRYLQGAADSETGWDEDQRKIALDLMGIPLEFQENPPIPVSSPDPVERKRIQTELAQARASEIEQMHLVNAQRSDDSDRDRALRGCESATDRELLLYRRYERDAWRHFDQACADLRRIQAERASLHSWMEPPVVHLSLEDQDEYVGPNYPLSHIDLDQLAQLVRRYEAQRDEPSSAPTLRTLRDETISAAPTAPQPAVVEAAAPAPKPAGDSRLVTKQFPTPVSLRPNLRADISHPTPEKPRGNRRHRKMLAAQQRKLARSLEKEGGA